MARPAREMSGTSDLRGVTALDGTSKARIERAALNLFAARGVNSVTTREIAAAAQLSEGALYRHFPSKDALAEGIFFEIHDRLARLMRAAGNSAPKITDQARAIVEAYCQTADDDWALFSFHLLSMHRFLPGSPKQDNPVAAIEDLTSAAMDRGDIPEGDAKLIAAMTLGVVTQPALHKAYGRINGDLSAHREPMTRAVKAILANL